MMLHLPDDDDPENGSARFAGLLVGLAFVIILCAAVYGLVKLLP